MLTTGLSVSHRTGQQDSIRPQAIGGEDIEPGDEDQTAQEQQEQEKNVRCESPRASYASQAMYYVLYGVNCGMREQNCVSGWCMYCKEGSLQQQMSGQAAVLDFEVRFS